ncbi:MAG: class I SAM-dependent methyltransferase [Actinomycetota bacterium]
MSKADAFRQVEREMWERGSHAYWQSFAPIMDRVAAELLDRLAVHDGEELLDLATGPGWVAGGAAARGARVVAADISRAMVELGASLYPAVRFVQADGEALPFPSSSFDVAVSNLGLPHVARPSRMVAEMVRVTRQGGRVALTTHDAPSATALVGLVNDAVVEVGARLPAVLRDAPSIFHHGFPGDAPFAYLLEDGGLSDVIVGAIAFQHLTTAADLWNMLARGSARGALLVESQPAPTRNALRVAFARLALRFGTPENLEIPISIKLAIGTKLELKDPSSMADLGKGPGEGIVRKR